MRVASNQTTATARDASGPRVPASIARWVIVLAVLLFALPSQAALTIGPWIPKFKGVDFSLSTNIPPSGGEFPSRAVVYALRVDLSDPDVRFMTTPRLANNYVVGDREIGGLTVTEFLRTNRVQAAINANFFSERIYYLPAGTPMDLYGLAVCQGVVVSPQDVSTYAATMTFDAKNQATVIHTNWPAASTDGVYTAVTGNYPLLVAGRNVAPRTGRLENEPRTAFGVSQDRRYLYLVAIDGRQPGYSDGAYDYETAGWLLLLGAYDGVNMDGGGSTTMVLEDTTGAPLRMNKSSAVADSGRERTVGSHFGVIAKPLRGFINDVLAVPDDTTAKLVWTTTAPATSQVQYGITTALGSSSGLQSDPVTEHSVLLTGLAPATAYYYKIVATDGTQQYVSPSFSFVTTNYVTTNEVFGRTNFWKYATAELAGAGWKSPGYDDARWSGPGPGLLWIDTRGPNSGIETLNTKLPADPITAYPYATYYFRTHFPIPKLVQGTSLAITGFIDDGAIFYLNGTEIYRLRMPANAGAQTLAVGFPCDGDATCADELIVPASALASLVEGDNVLAVEVHNYNIRSADITFGISLNRIEPVLRAAAPKIAIQHSGATITLSWEGKGMILQWADDPRGPWTDLDGTTESPVNLSATQSIRFYRLRQ
jgi:hypothetical protein